MIKFGNNDTKLYLGNNEIEKVYLGTSQVYEGEEPTPPTPVPYDEQYLTFVAEADNVSVGLTYAHNNVFQYSVDSGTTWSNIANNERTTSVNSGETIMFKAENPSTNGIDGIGVFALSATNRFSVQGNIMSLIYGDNFIGQTTLRNTYQFASLLWNCSGLISAEHLILPATTLTNLCYNSMLNNCPNLIKAPELPATTLAINCYGGIFKNCTSLTTAPELPATTLASNCYVNMFQGCTSLTKAPDLPATTLAEHCYQHMFEGCTSLNYIKCLATNISATDCTDDWVFKVTSTGTFVKAASMSSWTTGSNGIPTGWTVQNDDGSLVDDGGGWDDPIGPGGDDQE